MSNPGLRHRDREDPRYFDNDGTFYIDFMQLVRSAFDVQSYFEVGSHTGKSLLPVTCDTVAVDPSFKFEQSVVGAKRACMLFQMTSDAFFDTYDLGSLFGGPVDMAFLDGLHFYEYLLRDFMNTEKHMRRNSVIFMHDCMPPTFEVSRRTHPGPGKGWAGDVWKAVPILQKYRPDLHITPFDCRPTGLVMVTNLDPTSTVLEEHYFDAVKDMTEGPDDEKRLAVYRESLEPVSTKPIRGLRELSPHIWL
jgi:hypothetical protein